MPPSPRCQNCQRPHARSHAFCPNCGAPLNLRPELKHVSVVFADLCDSTRLISGRSPEAAQQFLQSAIDIMVAAVESFGGTLSQDRGDGIVAVFGAPRAQEDHALRAALAALQMQRQARSQSLTLRVGIHSGETLVKVVAASVDAFHGIDGSTVHLAARLEQLAQPGTVLVSHDTFRQLHDQIEARPLGQHAIRGFDERQTLYELTDLQGASAAAPMARRRHLAPLVGREEPLTALMTLAAQAGSGLRVIGLRGEAGVGKSRLLAEFIDGPAVQGFLRAQVHCRSYLTDSPLSAAASLAEALLELRKQAPESGNSDTDADKDLLWDLDLPMPPLPAGADVALSALIGRLPADHAEWNALSPRLHRQRMAQGLEALLRSMASRRPLLLSIEDCHFADHESQRLLDTVLRRLGDARLLVCLSYRPEYTQRWLDEPWFSDMLLQPLSVGHMRRMAQALLGDDASLRSVHEALVERSDGKPFFLEQLAIALVDEGTLVGPPGGYRMQGSHARLPAPGSIALVTAAVVDRMPLAAKQCLCAAAVLGGPIRRRHVAQVTGQSDEQVVAHLKVCVDAGLLRGTPEGHEFRHALVQDAVLTSLTRSSGVTLHRAVHAVLARDHAHEPQMAAVIARHAFDGELWSEAAAQWARAIPHSVQRSANRDALRHFQLGCEAVLRVSDLRLQRELEMSLRIEAIAAQMPLGQLDEMLSNLARAGTLAHELGDTRRLASVTVQRSVLLWMRGDYRQALTDARVALEAGEAAGRRALQLSAQEVCVMSYHGLGRYLDAVDLARGLQREYTAELTSLRFPAGWATVPAVNLCAFLASSLWHLDRLDEAEAACEQADSILAQRDHPYSRGLIDYVRAQMWIERGRAPQAMALMQEAVRACERHDLLTLHAGVAAHLGGAMALCGRAPEAVDMLERMLASAVVNAGGTYMTWNLHHFFALALLHAGREEEALARARHAAHFALHGQQFGHLVRSQMLEGQILATMGQVQAAITMLGKARLRAQRNGMTYLERHASELITQVGAGVSLAHTGELRRD